MIHVFFYINQKYIWYSNIFSKKWWTVSTFPKGWSYAVVESSSTASWRMASSLSRWRHTACSRCCVQWTICTSMASCIVWSWGTVDGGNPAPVDMVNIPLFRVSYIPGGAGFQPSTGSLGVCWELLEIFGQSSSERFFFWNQKDIEVEESFGIHTLEPYSTSDGKIRVVWKILRWSETWKLVAGRNGTLVE